MISQLISGSRLPVGSSAMIRRGSWTSARAIAVRCCSPPDSCEGSCSAWALRPTSDRTRSTAGPIWRRGRPGDLEGEADVLPNRLGRQQLEVLEDDPDLAPDPGNLPATQAGHILAVEDHRSAGRDLVPDEQLDQGRLAGARRADQEHEVALGDGQVDVTQGGLAVGVGLGDVVQHENGLLIRRLGDQMGGGLLAKRTRGGSGRGRVR